MPPGVVPPPDPPRRARERDAVLLLRRLLRAGFLAAVPVAVLVRAAPALEALAREGGDFFAVLLLLALSAGAKDLQRIFDTY